MRVVILGCGRVGATLAIQLEKMGNTVSIIDNSSDAFQRLEPYFRGERIVGNGVDEEVLRRAGVEKADAFIAVTNGDNRNIMASQIAKELLHVKKVLCRIYDPIRESTYRALGLETMCPTTVGAQLLLEALTREAPSAPTNKK